MRELTNEKRIIEKNNFLRTLGLYLDTYNNDSELYIFDVLEIKNHMKSLHLNDVSLFVTENNDFVVDGKIVSITTEKSLHIEHLIGTVLEFLPEHAYSLVESMARADSNNTDILFDGMKVYKCDRGGKPSDNLFYILINNVDIYQHDTWKQLSDYPRNSLTLILGPLVVTIGEWAFNNCVEIRAVFIPDSVTSIEKNAFYNCCSLTSIVIPDSVTSVERYAFAYCKNLTSVIIGNSVTTIAWGSFERCVCLTSVVMGDLVTTIYADAFKDCRSLNYIDIPDSVTNIGYNAFKGCERIIRNV
jgi:hypothetical protein